jgi:hypothetical protein
MKFFHGLGLDKQKLKMDQHLAALFMNPVEFLVCMMKKGEM